MTEPATDGVRPAGPGADELQALVDAARDHGRVPLVVLSEDEEHVVSGGRWALSEAESWQRWVETPDDARHRRGREALDALTARGAVRGWRVDDGRLELVPSPELHVVAEARTHGDVVAYGATDGGASCPRVYGLADDTGRLGFVIELVGPHGHDYRLLSGPRAVEALAQWLVTAVSSDELGPRSERALVRSFRPKDGTGADAGVEVAARPSGRPAVVTRSFDGAVTTQDDAGPDTVRAAVAVVLGVSRAADATGSDASPGRAGGSPDGDEAVGR